MQYLIIRVAPPDILLLVQQLDLLPHGQGGGGGPAGPPCEHHQPHGDDHQLQPKADESEGMPAQNIFTGEIENFNSSLLQPLLAQQVHQNALLHQAEEHGQGQGQGEQVHEATLQIGLHVVCPCLVVPGDGLLHHFAPIVTVLLQTVQNVLDGWRDGLLDVLAHLLDMVNAPDLLAIVYNHNRNNKLVTKLIKVL